MNIRFTPTADPLSDKPAISDTVVQERTWEPSMSSMSEEHVAPLTGIKRFRQEDAISESPRGKRKLARSTMISGERSDLAEAL
jgi:hypothetical protein